VNLYALLQLPWRAVHRSLRWLGVFVLASCGAGALAIGLLANGAHHWQGSLALFGLGLFVAWGFFYSCVLLLAIDTHLLRVPQVQRQIVASLLLHGLLTVALPLAVLVPAGMPWLATAVALGLFGVFGLLFALMPRYLAIFIGIVPSLLGRVWKVLHMPGLLEPQFVSRFGPLLLALLLLVAWRWHALLRSGGGQVRSWSSPMVLQFRSGSWGQWSNLGDNRQLRQRPKWLLAEPSLHGVGPAALCRTLRVALGGWYLPQTARSYAKQLGVLLASASLPLLVILVVDSQGRNANDFIRGAMLGALSSLALMSGSLIPLLSVQWLRRWWLRDNAERQLLALLPGLGEARSVKHQLLRVSLGMPLAIHALLIVGGAVAMLVWPRYAEFMQILLLAQLGAAAVTVALLLGLLGGRLSRTWQFGVPVGVIAVLTVCSMVLAAMAHGRQPVAWVLQWSPVAVLAWLLFGIALFLIGRRGWRGLQQRPHPFLPN
jgi:hypothetical protein